MREGYFFIALGRYYIDECYQLAQTIRKQGDDRPIGLLVWEKDLEYAIEKKMFSMLDTVIFNPRGPIWDECKTDFEKYCLYPRIHFDKLIPKTLEAVIIVDSDMICQYNADKLWKAMHTFSLPVKMLGRYDDPKWHWGHIAEVSKAFGRHVPHVHGGFFFIKQGNGQYVGDFFECARKIFWMYDDYRCLRAFRGGRVDEIIFALVHASFRTTPIEFDHVPAMTFNYTPEMPIPSKIQTEGGQMAKMSDYIPFVHMFDKMTGPNYQALYNKVMNVL